MKPLIGISCRYQDGDYYMRKIYAAVIRNAGGIPVGIPVNPPEDTERYAAMLDGFLIPGGIDSAPQFYGEEPHPAVTYVRRDIDLGEIAMVKAMIAQKKPLMGICRGHQIINVALGGTLYQDLPTQTKYEICHKQDEDTRNEGSHTVVIEKDSLLHKMIGSERILVNTLHHQAVKTPGAGLRISAKALDDTIEALEDEDGMILCTQWHPEDLAATCPEEAALFEAFVTRCKKEAEQRKAAMH